MRVLGFGVYGFYFPDFGSRGFGACLGVPGLVVWRFEAYIARTSGCIDGVRGSGLGSRGLKV